MTVEPQLTSPAKRGVIDRINFQAAKMPHKVAIECGTEEITYADLRTRIDERRRVLSASIREPGSFVAIERERSVELVVDFMAVLGLNGTPVVVDPQLPRHRREALLGLVRPVAVLRDSVPVVRDREPGGPVVPVSASEDGAYVFFTSGSSGQPKPVLGSAAALTAFLDWQSVEFSVRPHDRIAFLTALSFDVMVRDIFLPLWAGATLVIPTPGEADSPASTVEWMDVRGITMVNAVPSVARSWLRHGRGACAALRTVFFAGEPLDGGLLAEWDDRFPGVAARVNFYGTTETTLPKLYRVLDRIEPDDGILPVGRPVPQSRFCLIDSDQPFDAHAVRTACANPRGGGEVVLVTPHASHGYLGMPVETSARFVELGDGVTAYRTGDIGRVNGSGELVVGGRTDDEVKINGVRIHPAEVVAAIRADERIRDAFVAPRRSGDHRLVAFVVPASGHPLEPADLRRRLMTMLPPAMIPARFVTVEALPTLPSGKIDRAALQRIGEEQVDAAGFVEPSGPIERWLADAWADLFGVASVSATADFLAAGGDSILAMQLISRIRREFQVTMTVRMIFTAASLSDIAGEITDRQLLSMDADELLAMLDELEGAHCHD